MSTDPTLASKGTETVRSHPPGEDAVREDAVLDDAIRRADDLLVQSLRVEERQRKRRRTLRRLLIPIGVIAMLAIAYCIALSLGLLAQSEPTAAAPAADDHAKAGQLSTDAWQLWQNRELSEAESKFQQAVKLDPSLADAWNGLGWAQFNQGKGDGGEAAFQKAVALQPGHAAAENGLGQLYFSKRQYDKAEKHFLVSVKTPGSSAAWYGLAKLYLIRAQWDKAAEYAQKLVDIGQADAQPMLDAAKNHKVPDALREVITPPAPEKVTAAKPKNDGPVDPAVQRAWVLLNKGQGAQAVTMLQGVLSKNPDDANALNGLGWAYLRTGKQDQAKDAFEKAIKADPNAAGSINGLAICLKSEGKLDEAMKLWRQMVDKYPGPNAGTYGLASAYVEQKQYDKALPLAQQLAASDPSNQEFKQLLARAQSEWK